MDKWYAVFNTATNEFYGKPNLDKLRIKNEASFLNAAMKPEYQTYTVATIILDTEV